MRSQTTPTAGNAHPSADRRGPAGVRGCLLVYVVGLGYLLLHGLALTVASVVIYADPAVVGLPSSVPLPGLLYYVVTNVLLAVLAIVSFVLMAKRRRTAIVSNEIYNLLSILLLLSWHLFGEKSDVGTVVDILPGVLGLAYFLTSRRVRNTFVHRRRRGIHRLT